jgi:hypothetical protein
MKLASTFASLFCKEKAYNYLVSPACWPTAKIVHRTIYKRRVRFGSLPVGRQVQLVSLPSQMLRRIKMSATGT